MGAPFYFSAIKSLKHRSANMDVLVVLGTTASWLYGFALLFVGYHKEEMDDKHMYEMQVM